MDKVKKKKLKEICGNCLHWYQFVAYHDLGRCTIKKGVFLFSAYAECSEDHFVCASFADVEYF